MPLFHIHGLIAAVLVLARRPAASIYCTPGFNALRFFPWLDDAQPTWYTAVPTMHQAILPRAERNPEIAGRGEAALHPLLLGLAAAAGDAGAGGDLRLPGDRELRHDRGRAPDGLATRCRRAPRKPGSVGIAAGPEVAHHATMPAASCRPAPRARW